MRGLLTTATFALIAGTCLAGPVEITRSTWLYPECSFQDGRDRAADGAVADRFTANGVVETGDPEDTGPFAACFAEGSTPTPEQWAQLDAAMAGGYVSRYNVSARWAGSPGDPIDLTWSFVPDGLSINDGGIGGTQASVLFARLDSQFGAANRATWIAQFTNVFARWQTISGVNYTRVMAGANPWDDGAAWGTGSGPTRGHVRIAMKNNFDGQFGILAYNQFPTGGDMVLDGAENWASSSQTYRFLRNTLSHEHGHGLGFPHVCPINNTKLMEPSLSTAFDGPQQDDLRAVHHNYGDPLESNDTPATATIMGTLAPGSTTTVGTVPSPTIPGASNLSVVQPNDSDYFRISLAVPRLVNITLTPVGTTYTDLDQNANGTCQTTPTGNMNAMAQANLEISAYTSNGTTLLRTDNSSAVGVAEVLTGILLNEGDSYIRARGSVNFTSTQCYTMTVVVQNASLTCNASDGAFADKVLITWPAVPEATAYRVMRSTTNDTSTASTLADVSDVTLSYDDTTAVPGTTYYYWIRAQQTGSTLYRYMSNIGSPGFRGVANNPPTAVAGADQLVHDLDGSLSEPVTLDGSGSTDTDGAITNYLWQEGGTTLANGTSATALVNLSAGQHTIQLTVTDNLGATGFDFVVVTVNRLPLADAGPDASVTDGDNSGTESVVLDGSGSTDPDGSIANYEWAEGATVLASGPNATANVDLAVGVHVITLTVTDNRGVTDTDTVTVTVEAGTPPTCEPDFNQDGNVDQDDVSCLIDIVAGNAGCSSLDPDFNQDGNVDQDDVAALINVVAGGPCP